MQWQALFQITSYSSGTLWKNEINSAFQALYETDFGKIIQMLAFALKDRTSSVVNMTNFLISVNSPSDVFIENEKNSKILRRYSQVYKVYSKLLENAKSIARSSKKVIFFLNRICTFFCFGVF